MQEVTVFHVLRLQAYFCPTCLWTWCNGRALSGVIKRGASYSLHVWAGGPSISALAGSALIPLCGSCLFS